YPETDDQLRCIADIKHDMESPIPMDRLLCGDVGFGKTEVALRAVMKAVMDGKQVAILVPTTVLAQQHYQTAVARFRGFPVTIDVLSRFRTPKMQQQTLQKLRAGSVDLIIGTHKLLQKTVQFKDLGLLIVDEEQRFGVSHKERLKELSKGVDVLTLSATPIPRTLNMALSGIRDMSTIEQPPADRYPVQTFVMEYANPLWTTPSAGKSNGAGRSITSTTAPKPSTSAPPRSNAGFRASAWASPTARWARTRWET
ncbi:MAG: DEAD/DEAH box helicase, partial [Oscillospiraceae bacterium]